jgi:Ni/Fe-hydrogenase subunit HybB-like protein
LAYSVKFDMFRKTVTHEAIMTKSIKRINLKKLATLAGIALVTLALVDTAYQWKSSGFGVSSQLSGNSAPAFILVGIIVGMMIGIGMAFGYFMWKEKQLNEKPDELALLLEELSREESFFLNEPVEETEEKSDALEPWERPTDWWKGDDD